MAYGIGTARREWIEKNGVLKTPYSNDLMKKPKSKSR